jgi:glucan biosynthesis protein C
MPNSAPPEGRLIFFDNLRYLFVLFVVVEHSAHAYDGSWFWAAVDANSSLVAGWLSAFSDVFAMPLLFYIAGYFALPNIQKKGVAGFLKGKLKRLGIPWLVCIFCITPIFKFIYHFTRDDSMLLQSYWSLWLEEMHSALQFTVGFINSMSQFAQHYMWFLSLLLLFFLLFAFVFALKKDWVAGTGKTLQPKTASTGATLRHFFFISLATTLASFVTVMLMMETAGRPEPWFMLGNVIQFRPSRLFFYLLYFGLGVATYRNNWLERGWFPGRLRVWAGALVLLMPAFLVAYQLLRFGAPDLRELYGPIYFLILNFLCAACLGLSLSLGQRYWNKPSSFDRKLAANSYNIYLAHYPYVLTTQMLLLPLTAIPGALKFIMVAASSGLLSYASCNWLIGPHPRLAVAAAFGLWALMTIFIRP